MPIIKALVYTPTGEFRGAGSIEPSRPILSVVNGITTYDPDYAVVTLPGDAMPTPRTQKWNGSAVVAKTQAEIAAYDAAQLAAHAERESLTPDNLATAGLAVWYGLGTTNAARNSAWNAMTGAQKKQAVATAAGVFKTMREFFDKGVA